MLPNDIDFEQAHERLDRLAVETERMRRPATAGAIRRAIGYRFVALGRRIAAEPKLELATSNR